MMKRLWKPLAITALSFLALGWCSAQSGHSVTLTVSSPDTSVASPGTATVLRASGACPVTGLPTGGTTLTSTLSVPGTGTYKDATVVGGNTYCYWAHLVTVGGGSADSNTFLGQITVSVSVSGSVQ